MNRLECKIYEGFETNCFLRFDRYERVVSSRTIGIYSFVRRKNGEEEIKYDLDACEGIWRNLRNYRLPRAGDALSQSLAGHKGRLTFA
jgi:hypothetical protein